MKRKMVLLLVAAMLVSTMFTGCKSRLVKEDAQPSVKQETKRQQKEDEEKNRKEDEFQETEDEKDTDISSSANIGDIKPVKTSLEKPAKVGDWVQATRYSAQDKRNHVVYYRITGVKRGDDVEKTIRAWNEADHITKFQDIKDDDLEYCSFTYDVYFPEDYPEAEWGITSASLSFSVTDKDGGGITDENGTSYIGLSSVHDVSATVENNTLHAGDTFHGESVYAMVKSVHDYVFEIGIPQSRRL